MPRGRGALKLRWKVEGSGKLDGLGVGRNDVAEPWAAGARMLGSR